MKRILLLSLLLLPIVALAQYPTFSNKQKLGVQTTGDGLIYRGGIHPNYYTPSNINNAYFYLDTTTSKLYLYSVGTWQQVYPTASDTLSLGAYLLKSDTLSMLLPYLRKSDTISLSNRINNKLSLADTASMLLPYLKLADTTSMLSPYFRDSDTTMLNLIARFNSKLNTTDTVSLSNRIDLKLNKTDTINLSNRIDLKLNKSDTISLSNRIDIKLNPSDTVSLSNRINKKLDTIYIQYQNYLDTIVNKDTINISNTLTEGFGINIIADSINIDSAVILATQQKQIAYVKNESGVTMYKGQAVYSSGSSGTNKLVTLASSSTEQTSSKTFGVVESESIPNGSHGYIITFGLLDKINTDNLTEGSSVYLSSTPGQLTTTKPQAPLHLVTIGVCIRRQQNNGSIFVKIQNGFELDEIHDVRITTPVDNSSLYYKSSEKLWRDTTATLLVSDTASMLSKYVNTYSNQTNINGDKTFNNTVTIDSATVTGKLLVNTNINDAVKITSNTNSTNLELMNNSGTVYIKSSNKNMILQTDTTALVYLNGNNKKVGILTMNPQQELQVAGNVRIDSLNNNLVPINLVGSSNNNDLTSVHLGQGLSFTNDTLKVDLTIIDTAIAASSITLVGNVSGTGSTNSTVNTTINNGVVTNDMLAGGILDSKLNTITTAGKVDNSATTATSFNNPNTIVLRDNNRDFTARNITATNFYGLASTATLANTIQSSNTTGIIKLTTSSNSVLPILTVPDANATIATTNLNQTFGGTQTFTNTIVGNISGNAATVTSVTPSNFANQSANTVLAAPNGSSGTPSFRSLVSSDIPSLNYLPLSGGVLSGGLTGTTGTFTGLNVNNTNVNGEGILTLKSYNFNFANKIQFGDGAVIRREIIYPNSSSNMQFRSYTVGGSSGGYDFYVSNGSTESLAATIGSDKSLSLTGTLGVTGATTLSDDLILRTSGGSRFQTAIRHYYEQQSRYAGEIQFLPEGSAGSALAFITNQSGFGQTERMRINQLGNVNINNNLTVGGTLGVTSNITANSFIKSGGTFNQFLKADGTVDGNDYLTTSSAASIYYPKIGGTISGTINRQEGLHDGSASTFYYNILNYFARRDNNKGGQTAQITFTDRPGTSTFPNNVRTSDIYLMTAKNFSGGQLGQYLDTTLSVVANQDGGRLGISKLNPVYKLDVNGTLGVSGTTVLSSLQGTDTRMVVANNTGVLSTQAIPTSTGTVTNVSANSTTPNGLSVATGTTTPVISIALADNGITGVVSNNTQSFSGSKTFINSVDVNGFTSANGGLIVNANTSTSTLTRLIGISDANGIGKITTGSGLSLTNGVLSVNNKITDINTSQYTILANDFYIDNFNNSSTTIILPLAGLNTYRELKFKNSSTGAVIANGNIIPLSGSGTTTTILPATNAKWCTLVSDGGFWRIMQSN